MLFLLNLPNNVFSMWALFNFYLAVLHFYGCHLISPRPWVNKNTYIQIEILFVVDKRTGWNMDIVYLLLKGHARVGEPNLSVSF